MSLSVHYCPSCGVGFKIKEFDAEKAKAKETPKPVKLKAHERIPESVKDDYEAGASLLDLSIKYAASTGSIAKRITSLGGVIRLAGSLPGTTNDSQRKVATGSIAVILSLDSQGFNHAAIGKRFGVSRERIRQICLEHGQPARRERQRAEIIERSLAQITQRESKQAINETVLNEASRLWKKGEPVVVVAECLGLTFNQFRGKIDMWRRRCPDHFPRRGSWPRRKNGSRK